MNTSDLQTFNQAVAAAQSGQTQAAHITLGKLNQQYPTDTNVLLWLAFTTSDSNSASYYIENVARLEPNNPSLHGARDWLASQKPVMPQAQAIPEPVFEPVGAVASSSSASSHYQTVSNPLPSNTLPSQFYGDTTETSFGNSTGTTSDEEACQPRKSKKPGPILIAGAISFVAVTITIVLLLTGMLNGPAFNGVGDIPAPPNGLKIPMTFDNDQLHQFAQLIGDRQEGEYRVPDGKYNDVVAFYKKQMADNGWVNFKFALMGSSNSGSVEMYKQGDAYAGILIFPPLTAAEAKYRASQGSQLKAGDVDVILLQDGDSN